MPDILRRKKGIMTEFLSIDRVLARNIFMENHAENVPQKLVPDPFLILVNNPKQPLHTRNYFEKGLSKSSKKVNFNFSFEPSLF